MIGCLRTRVRKQPITALYFESENELKFYNLEGCFKNDILFDSLHVDSKSSYNNSDSEKVTFMYIIT